MSDLRDTALLKSKKGNLELIPMQVEDASDASPMILKGANGALYVDVQSLPNLNINSLPDIEIADGEGFALLVKPTGASAYSEWAPFTYGTATIADTGTESGVVSAGGKCLVRFKVPSDFTGNAVSFKSCLTSDGIFADHKTEVGAVLIDVTSLKGDWVTLTINADAMRDLLYFKFVSDSSESGAKDIEYVLA